MSLTALLLVTGSPPQSLSPYHHRLTPDTDVHHPTKYSQRRRLEALTPANTNPIRLALDFASLDEATAPAYSACFKVGAWFRRGLPDGGAEPPADGKETCDRGPNEWNSYDCWGKCIAEDLVSAEGRQMIIDVVTSAAAEISGFFAVEPVDGNLVFAESTSRYSRALILKGYDTTPACAFDCTALNGVAVASSYCDTGVAADVVLSVTKPPTIQGVGGTGGSCAADQRGRPTWLVFSWIQSVAKEGSVGSTVEQSLAMYRNLIVHELIHALGFSSHSFSNARDGAGARKGLISLMPVTDLDGESDEVWYFRKGRALETAGKFFGCADDEAFAAWDGLPLMGAPEMGRASHWDTRIMRDDVMSYGYQGAVSAVRAARAARALPVA